MTVERKYKDESNFARRSARETLLAFREARLRARQGKDAEDTASGPTASNTAKTDGHLISPGSFFSMDSGPKAEVPDAANAMPDSFPDAPSAAMHADTEETGTDPLVTVEDSAPATDTDESESAMESALTPAPEAMAPSDDELAGNVSEAAATEAAPTPAPSDPDPEQSADQDMAEMQAAETGAEMTADAPDMAEDDDPSEEDGASLAAVDPETDLFDLPGAGAGMIWMFHQCGIRNLADLAKADARDLSLKLGVVGHILNMEPWLEFAKQRQGATD